MIENKTVVKLKLKVEVDSRREIPKFVRDRVCRESVYTSAGYVS